MLQEGSSKQTAQQPLQRESYHQADSAQPEVMASSESALVAPEDYRDGDGTVAELWNCGAAAVESL